MKQWAINIGLAIVAALAPIHSVIITVGVLVVFDMITGVWAAIKRGDTVRSAALRRTVSKFFIYQLTLITGFLVQQYLTGDLLPITKILGGIIGIVELKSILENANTINGADIFKAFSYCIDMLGTPYGYLDILAIAFGLKYKDNEKTLICSEYVARAFIKFSKVRFSYFFSKVRFSYFFSIIHFSAE